MIGVHKEVGSAPFASIGSETEKATLQDYGWQRTYSDETSNIVSDFLIPALQRSITYDRVAGFFGSSMLSVAARGITKLIANGGKMRLVASVRLTKHDVEAINAGLDERKAVESALLRVQLSQEDFEGNSRLKALAWMVAAERLEIKVAVPVKNGKPVEAGNEMFHPKVGIFTDSTGNRLSFSGSINETGNAWTGNNEEFKAFTSWDQPGYVRDDVEYFEALWNDKAQRSKVYEFPQAVKQRMIRYAPAESPLREPEEVKEEPTDRHSLATLNFARDAPFLSNADALSDAFLPFQPRLYQLAVADAVVASYPRRFILADEVGLGKTIETGLALRRLLEDGRVRRCLILTPASILRQWQEHLRDKFGLNFYRYDGQSMLDAYGSEVRVSSERPLDSVNLILASTSLVARSARQLQVLEASPWDMIILDEAHHARRQNLLIFGPGPRDRGEPNLLLRLMQKLEARTIGLLLLTATPMQLNVIELFDLLKLLGMRGMWAADEDLFQEFYISLSAEELGDGQLLFDLARDYIQSDGMDREYDDWVRSELGPHSWSRIRRVLLEAKEPVTETRKLSKEEKSYLRGYIARSTPLHSLMFRNTRAILEDYKKKGLGSDTFPKRRIEDVFVKFESMDEKNLYDEIEEYVTQFYRLAEERHALILKLVMQMFRRRLTSSFAAVRKSLKKRLNALERGEGGVVAALQEEEDAEDYELADTEDEDYSLELAKREEEYLRGFIDRLDELGGADSKMKQFQKKLKTVQLDHDRVLIFTQYTDTMDYVRDQLVSVYGSRVGCYSGRGGEVHNAAERKWIVVPKAKIEEALRTGEVKILIGTEAMGEGLDLQSASAVMNYDMPWNPMRVEQRIGRVDRIGQMASSIDVINFFYEDTIEAQIYKVVERRHRLFKTVVGETPGILAAVTGAIQEGAMVPPEQRQKWLEEKTRELERQYEEFKRNKLVSDEMTRKDHPLPLDQRPNPPVGPKQLEEILTKSTLTKGRFTEVQVGVYAFSSRGSRKRILTFQLDRMTDEISYLHYYSPILKEIFDSFPQYIAHKEDRLVRVSSNLQSPSSRKRVAYYCKPKGEANLKEIITLEDLEKSLGSPETLEIMGDADRRKAQELVDRTASDEIKKEKDLMERYKVGVIESVRARCRILVDRIVAVQIALRSFAISSFEPPRIEELTTQGRAELMRLFKQRQYAIPALSVAANIELTEYTLPPYALREYIGQETKFLEGTLGQLVQQAYGQLERFKLTQETKSALQ